MLPFSFHYYTRLNSALKTVIICYKLLYFLDLPTYNEVMKMRNFFKNLSVKKQLYSTFFCLFFPFLAVSLSLLATSRHMMIRHYQNIVETDNNRIRSVLFGITTNIYNLSEQFAEDKELKQMLDTSYEDPQQFYRVYNSYGRLNRTLKNEAMLSAITLYTDNRTIPENAYVRWTTDQIRTQHWYEEAVNHARPFWDISIRKDFNDRQYRELCLYRKITIPGSWDFCIIKFTVNPNYINALLESDGMEVILALENGPVFFSSLKDLENDMSQNLWETSALSQANVSATVRFFTFGGYESIGIQTYYSPYRTDSHILTAVLNTQAPGDLLRVTASYSLIIFIISLTLFIAFAVFGKYFTGRVQIIRSMIHRASRKDYSDPHRLSGEDEFSAISSDLEQLIRQIRSQEKEVYSIQLEKEQLKNEQREMEFKVLASQINPHFLYNTLETIRMKAFTAGNREVAKAIKLLSKIMRYVLDNTGTTVAPLARELDYIQTYLEIQKLRFHDRFCYDMTIEHDLDPEAYLILPLLLQPIVENSIRHGLEGLESDGQIHIVVGRDKEDLLITVSDNGCGMSTEDLKALREKLHSPSSNNTVSIGMSNIERRIQLYYGKEYGLSVSSSPLAGTVVTIRLPLVPGEGT